MQLHIVPCHSSQLLKKWDLTVHPPIWLLAYLPASLTTRFKGAEPRRPSEIMGFIHHKPSIMLFISYAFTTRYFRGDVTEGTHKSE